MNRAEQAEKTTKALYGGASALGVTDPEFAAIKERLIYGEVYAEEKLSARLRELVILVVATTNQTMNEVKRHTAAALACGVKPEEIKEAVYHCAPYIGLGKAENAVNAEKGIVLPLASGQTVTEESRLLDGIAAQKSIFGDQIDAMRAAAPENQKNIQDYLSAYCFGDFYTRKFLTIPERELLTFAILVTFAILASQGGCEGQVKAHVGGNATVGNGKEVLLAALTVCLPYIGFPRTLNALSCINEVLPEAKQ